eukprot:scaffold1916_cov123-Isochrysis_galbana.AAC.3
MPMRHDVQHRGNGCERGCEVISIFIVIVEKKTPRARGGQRWRPDSSCWSWRRSKWPRKRARSEFALTAQTKAQPRCDCHSERLPAPPPSLAIILLA